MSQKDIEFDLFTWALQWVSGDVLDVGCGNGAYLALVDGAIGMDLSPGMLGAARARVDNPLVCADAQAIPFATASFDTVLAPHMLYHVPDRAKAARELRRVLRPGGVCIAVSNSGTTQSALIELIEAAVGRGWRIVRPSDAFFSMENGAAQLRAGFESVETVWAPDVTFSVTDADAVADYVASIGDHYGPQVESWIAWRDVVERCRERAATIIDRDGALPVVGRLGAFVCR